MTDDQRDLVRFFSALLAGFAASFIGGTVLLRVNSPQTSAVKIALSATAGLAIFVFFYSYPPYWYRPMGTKAEPFASPSPSPISGASVTPEPSPRGAVPATPIPAHSAETNPHDKPVDVAVNRPTGQQPTPTATPLPIVVEKAGRVLLLIEDEIIAQALTGKLSDYGLNVMTGSEIGGPDSARIMETLRQLQLGNRSAGASTPFAVVVTGKISAAPLGLSQGAYLAEAGGTLRAVVTNTGETFTEIVQPARGGGRSQDDAVPRALREAGQNISQQFIRLISARAR